jgi:hypothetical protein
MNGYPIQPDDETPLPQSMYEGIKSEYVGPIEQVGAEIATDEQELQEIIHGGIDTLAHEVMRSDDETHIALVGGISDIERATDDAGIAVYKALDKQLKSLERELEDAYTSLWEQGVKTPITMHEIVADLEDGSSTKFAERFIPIPQPNIQDQTKYEYHQNAICGKMYDYMNHPEHGWVCVNPRTGEWIPAVIPSEPEPTPSPPVYDPVLPPTPPQPPPLLPPVSPPPPPPAPPPQFGELCETEVSPHLVETYYFRKPPPVHYYVVVRCVNDCDYIVEIYKGTSPPPITDGFLAVERFGHLPEKWRVESLLEKCKNGLEPPVSPPTSPPTPEEPTKPPPGEEEEREEEEQEERETDGRTAYPTTPWEDGTGIHWGNADACEKAFDLSTKAFKLDTKDITKPESTGNASLDSLLDFSGLLRPFTSPILTAHKVFNHWHQYDLTGTVAELVAPIRLATGMLEDLVETGLTENIRNPQAALGLAGPILAASFIEQWTGFPATYLCQNLIYAWQYANPQYMPHQAEIDAQYLTGNIDRKLWDCYTRAQGNIPELAALTIRAKQTKPNAHEVVELYRRGKLGGKPEYHQRMRELGVLNTVYSDEWYELSQQLPGLSDQMRFLVRDVWDNRVVQAFGYDYQFDEKFTEEARKLAIATGVSPDWYKYYWRAHWDIPSNTALYEMLHRLRPDRPEVFEANKDQLRRIANPTENEGKNGPIVVEPNDVEHAIVINDMAPGWVSALMEISYRPITNTDASRAFEIGTFNENDLYHAFRDNGYNDRNAKTLVTFYKGQRSRKIANAAGVWTTRKTLKALKEGLIDEQRADDLLSPILIDPDVRMRAIAGAITEADVETKSVVVKSLRQRYIYGEFGIDDLRGFLGVTGVDPARIENIVRQWTAQRDGRMREPRVRMICEWYTNRLITYEEYFDRVMRLGYSSSDAANIVAVCEANRQSKAAREAAQAAEKARKETMRMLKDEKGELEKNIKELEKRMKELQKEMEKQQKELESQQEEQEG